MFLSGERGRIFALHFSPEAAPRAHIVYLPPFGEEMNRCRHLVAAQAQNFADRGYSCLVLDPYGTGDSDGELADATWEGWRADALAGVRWCQQQHAAPVVLWGLRLGAFLALDLAANHPGEFARLLLWQPVTNGKTFLTQALRARIAFLSGAELPPETTTGMREALGRGETVEVAGYVLGGALAGAIDELDLSSLSSLSGVDIHWLQQGSGAADGPSAGVQKAIELLRSQDNRVEVVMFDTPQLWQLNERADCQQLLDRTGELEAFRA